MSHGVNATAAPTIALLPPTIQPIKQDTHAEATTATTKNVSAYQAALENLKPEQRKQLENFGKIEDLYIQLKDSREKQKAKSLFERGCTMFEPYLGTIKTCVDTVQPFVSGEIISSTAFSLVGGTFSLAIAFCAARGKLDADMKRLLRTLPAIARCDESSQRSSIDSGAFNASIP